MGIDKRQKRWYFLAAGEVRWIMRNLTLFSKIILFLTSYIPLGVIFLIIDFDSFTFPFFKNTIYALILIVLIIALPILLFVLIHYFSHTEGNVIRMTVVSAQNMDSGTLAYIFTYILPFLGFPEEKRLGVLIFLLFIIGILYIRSDMLGINPLLAIFGYHIVKIEWTLEGWAKPQEVTVISKYDYYEIKQSTAVDAVSIHNELHLLKGVIQ
jgi:hypothetical protein